MSKPEKDKCHMVSLIGGIKKKKKRYKWPYTQNRNRGTDIENKLWLSKDNGGWEG